MSTMKKVMEVNILTLVPAYECEDTLKKYQEQTQRSD